MAFPLTAEQIVRLVSAVAAEVLDRTRHPDSNPVDRDRLLSTLADSVGIELPTVRNEYGWITIAPYRDPRPTSPSSPSAPLASDRRGEGDA